MTTYKDINIKKYLELKKVLDDTDDLYRVQSQLIAIVNDMTEEEVLNLPLTEYTKKVHTIDFLTEVPKISNRTPKKLNLNGRKYEVITDVRKLSAGQYIDFQTLMQSENVDDYLPNLLACFIMPEGENYGDYDVMAVADEIAEYLDIETAFSLMRFFQSASSLLISNTLSYLVRRMKKLLRETKDAQTKEKIQEAITQMKELQGLFKNGIGSTI